MKSLKSSGKLKKRRRQWLIVRRVVGDSMVPALAPGQLVVATGRFGVLHDDDIVIVQHDGLEKIKRIQEIRNEHIYLLGDNHGRSTDSRSFGWLHISAVQARIILPRPRNKTGH